MKISAFTPALVAVALLVGGCGPKKDAEPPKPKAASVAFPLPKIAAAPAWKLKDVNGNVVTSEQFKGKVVVLDFWATWCGPCLREIPGYVDLQRKYGNDGLAIVGLSIDEGSKAATLVKDFATKYGINYQMLMADDAVQAAFGGTDAIPTTFLIDRDGQIRDRKVGTEDGYEKKILSVLKGT
jgi:peroxiredoxin